MPEKPEWEPTHEITCDPDGSWVVMLYEGKFYTYGIWDRGQEPEWVVDEAGMPKYVADGWNPHDGQVRISIKKLPQRPRFVPDASDNTDPQLAAIRKVAIAFRRTIEKTGPDPCAPNLAHFPRNCCHHATGLLGLYFHDHTSLGKFTEICGEHNTKEHCWLQQGDVIVDITADQFNEGLPPVVVTKNSAWHRAWKVRPACPAGDHDEYLSRLRKLYEPLLPRLLANFSLDIR